MVKNIISTLIFILFCGQLLFAFSIGGNENGIWRQDSYGRVVVLTDTKIMAYDICKVSCIPSLVLPRKYMSMVGDIISADATTLIIKSGINLYHFYRIEEMPNLCVKKIRKKEKKDSMYNFESLWHTFNEQYCAFENRNIDWKATYDNYSSKITNDISEIDFYLLIEKMLGSINDGHVWINLPEKLEGAYNAIQGEKSKLPEGVTHDQYLELRKNVRRSIRDKYILKYKEYHKGLLRWGMTKERIAYLQLNAMDYFANYTLDESLEPNEYFDAYRKLVGKSTEPFKELIEGVEFIMDSILNDMEGAEAYILDIRFNAGGTDEVSLALMNRFAKERIKVFSKKARLKDGFTKDNEIYVNPSTLTFTEGPVFVLTSGQTASAAEIMTMCAYAMPNITIVGSSTEGIFSDILDKQMPNGWTYGVSNEVYETFDGKDWESIGIPPDHKIEYDRDGYLFFKSLKDGLNDGDDAIEWCLKQVKNKPN